MVAPSFGVKSRDGITTEVSIGEDDKVYLVCHNLNLWIEAAITQTTRKRKSAQLDSPTATIDINTTTRLTTAFANDNNDGIVEEHTVFDNNLEEEREGKRRVGYCTKFPRGVQQKE